MHFIAFLQMQRNLKIWIFVQLFKIEMIQVLEGILE